MKRSAILSILGLFATSAMAEDQMTNWAELLGTDIQDEWTVPQHRGFDFWIGEWRANWRGREEGEFHHQDEGDWTHQFVFPVLGGKALVELAEQQEHNSETVEATGFSIRYFDEARQRWVMAQHWPSPGAGGIAFLDQLIGVDRQGRHEFYSHIARPNASGGFDYRRYVFSDIQATGFRWDGSNSGDEGQTWKTWNIVEFHRIADFPRLTTGHGDLPTHHGGLLCPDEPYRNLDGLLGQWHGEVTLADGSTSRASFAAGRLLDGCAIAGMIEVPASNYMLFTAWSFTPHFERWINFRLDNAPGTTHEYRITADAEAGVFTNAPQLVIVDEFAQIRIGEAFETGASLFRTVIGEMSENRLTIRDQARDGPDAAWADKRVYEFVR